MALFRSKPLSPSGQDLLLDDIPFCCRHRIMYLVTPFSLQHRYCPCEEHVERWILCIMHQVRPVFESVGIVHPVDLKTRFSTPQCRTNLTCG